MSSSMGKWHNCGSMQMAYMLFVMRLFKSQLSDAIQGHYPRVSGRPLHLHQKVEWNLDIWSSEGQQQPLIRNRAPLCTNPH